MLYSDKRFDISEQILRTILRTNNQNKVESRRDKKKLEKESIISGLGDRSTREIELENRKKLAEKKAKRLAKEGETKEEPKEKKLDTSKPITLDFLTNPDKK